jgi:eukaryotic-like serine/threonine-protein kinase
LDEHDLAAVFRGWSGGDGRSPQDATIELAPGTGLGPYRIEALLGAGGMGQVYRARDTRLDRTVAIKILPAHLRDSPDVRSRFEREARAIAQLAHQNICALHDVGRQGDTDFLVMEYLEGETVAVLLSRGRMPVDQALRIAIEIAAALDHAHRRHIIHRDLKPGNVMLTKSGVKLLDFGLAKLRAPAAGSATETVSRRTQTAQGTLFGTLPYMPPEQLEGREVDARSDIWAFGCVFFELVSGRRAFDAHSEAALIAAILEHEPPPLSSVVPAVPPLIEHVIRTCLAKDPDRRWQSAADLTRELEWATSQPHPPGNNVTETVRYTLRKRILFAIVALLMVSGGALVSWLAGSRSARGIPSPPHVARFTIALPDGLTVPLGGLAISPDGQAIAFTATGPNGRRLYLRRISDTEVRSLPGTENANSPFFSPDGEWVGFSSMGRGIWKVLLRGGPAQQITGNGEIAGQTHGAVWSANDRIVYGAGLANAAGLWSVRAEDGGLQLLARAPGSGAVTYSTPDLEGGNDSIVFTIRGAGTTAIAAMTVSTGKIRTIIPSASSARYVSTGHLLYAAGGHLHAVPFDRERLQTRGLAQIIVDDVAEDEAGNASYAVANGGTLAYLPAATGLRRLVWIGRDGTRMPVQFEPRRYFLPELSPDDGLVTTTIRDGAAQNIWVGGREGGPLTKLTFGDDDVFSLFTRDGRRVLFTSGQNGRYNVFSTATDGSGEAERLTDSPHPQRATSFSPDGNVLLLNDLGDGTGVDILQMNVGRPESVRPFLKTKSMEFEGTFSPDGRWVAYVSDESGQFEVYVRAYPGPGIKRQISSGGGQSPVWNPRGGELLFQAPAAVMSVRLSDGVPHSAPAKVFDFAVASFGSWREWTISSDGLRFLAVEHAHDAALSQINVVLNWAEQLKASPSIEK